MDTADRRAHETEGRMIDDERFTVATSAETPVLSADVTLTARVVGR